MKVTINRTCVGSSDGIRVNEYQKGETVELPDALAEVFVRQGWAVNTASRKIKNAGAAQENKTVQPKIKRKAGGHGA